MAAYNKRCQLQKKFINKPKTICLTMIVKNESKNMLRLLNSVKSIIDFLSIVDTGSEDDTVNIIETWYKSNKIPGKVHHEKFINFGYNRTHSIVKARETFPQTNYYLLSDADFIWEIDIGGKFNKNLLHEHKYLVRQNSQNLSYFNIRMLSSEVDWECVGVTHEYWSEKKENRYKGEIKTHSLTRIQINDMEDGGCKSDKFVRDKRLLLEDLEKPNVEPFLKSRYTFYLAQTYKCLGEYENSIVHYKNRIDYGGWPEEVYFSMYQIGFNYQALFNIYKHCIHILNKKEQTNADIQYIEKYVNALSIKQIEIKKQDYFNETIKWYYNGWMYRPSRAESLYAAVCLLREHSEHRKAYDIALIGRKIQETTDTLFVEPNAYKWGFEYEISIVAYYLGPDEQAVGATACESLLARSDLPEAIRNRVIANTKFYT